MELNVFLIGLIISAIAGIVVLYPLLDIWLWPRAGIKYHLDKPDRLLALIIGVIDRMLFFCAFAFCRPEFVPFWITIKVAVHWKEWKEKDSSLYNVI